MFIPCEIEANEVSFAKIIRIPDPIDKKFEDQSVNAKNNLTIEGITEEGEVLFSYKNKEQSLSQRFGVNIKYYMSHLVPDFRNKDILADGAYLFKPDLKNLNSKNYG
jgi:hypothetical protein